ncbi:MAG: hypothetical protein J4N75_08625, partial [Chloroflexi bacterium]|nr:hypothetical protein [Chloroflexota bacterium]
IIAYGQARSVVQYMLDTYGPDRMAALFPVLQRTLNIDQALLEVYGMDQFGLDSAWRKFMGLEPLPSPEELESQLDETTESPDSESSGAEESSGDTEGATGAADEATSMPGPTPGAEGQPAGAEGDDGQESEGGLNSPGCSAPASGSGNVSIGLGMLLLLSTPLGLVALPRLRRRWPFR